MLGHFEHVKVACQPLVAQAANVGPWHFPEWRAQFIGKKPGKWNPHTEISNISGGTLSAMHIAEGVKKVLATYALFMPKNKG